MVNLFVALILAQMSSWVLQMQIELFDGRMLNPLLRFVEQNGARSEPILDRGRIPLQLIVEGGWVTKKQAYDFAFDVVKETGCQDAVFAAYLQFEFDHLGPIAAVMRSCKTVKESLDIGTRLGSTAYEGNEYFLHADGDTTWFCYREPRVVSDGQTFINDMTLTVYYQLIRFLVDEKWRPERMLIRREVIDRHRRVENFEDCQVGLHPEFSALAFPTEFLGRRLPPHMQLTGHEPEGAWRFGPTDFELNVERLYRLLASNFACRKLPTLEQVAKMVDTSQATLKRQLATAGTSYRGLLDRLRFDEACQMLSVPEISVKEIAGELGYSGTNNFVRSFRRMTGTTPEKYRHKQLLTGASPK